MFDQSFLHANLTIHTAARLRLLLKTSMRKCSQAFPLAGRELNLPESSQTYRTETPLSYHYTENLNALCNSENYSDVQMLSAPEQTIRCYSDVSEEILNSVI